MVQRLSADYIAKLVGLLNHETGLRYGLVARCNVTRDSLVATVTETCVAQNGAPSCIASTSWNSSFRNAALLDSDAAGDKAAEQEALWQRLTSKRILRTGDHIVGVQRAEIEDLLRVSLGLVARDECGWDSVSTIAAQSQRPIMEILADEHIGVSKWKLARAFVRWLSVSGVDALTEDEQRAWASLVAAANKALA